MAFGAMVHRASSRNQRQRKKEPCLRPENRENPQIRHDVNLVCPPSEMKHVWNLYRWPHKTAVQQDSFIRADGQMECNRFGVAFGSFGFLPSAAARRYVPHRIYLRNIISAEHVLSTTVYTQPPTMNFRIAGLALIMASANAFAPQSIAG